MDRRWLVCLLGFVFYGFLLASLLVVFGYLWIGW